VFAASPDETGIPRRYSVIDSVGLLQAELDGPPAARRVTIRDASARSNQCTPGQYGAVIGDVLYIAESGGGTIQTFRHAERSPDTLYVESRRQTVTPEVLAAVRQNIDPAGADSLDSYLEMIGRPGSPLPVWSDVRVDPGVGLLFLREAQCGVNVFDAPSTWTVVDTAGTFLGRIPLAERSTFLGANGGRLLIVVQDSIGVEYARLYRLNERLLPRR
jgi:hypothetical protein